MNSDELKKFKEECKKMEYSALLIESLSLKETIGRLNDSVKEKENAYQVNDILSMYDMLNEIVECKEKLRIVEDELKSR